MSQHESNQKNTKVERTISEETILKISKEITVKFIEVGRITPVTFHENFTDIYSTIDATVRKG